MSQALSSAAFQTFATLLKSRSGLVIGPDKLYLLETRLASILKRERLRDLAALADRLRAPARGCTRSSRCSAACRCRC